MTKYFVCSLPCQLGKSSIHPIEREQEILSCKSQKVQLEKYWVWKLLEYAVKKTYNKDFRCLEFTKNQHGKWLAKGFHFSLSHSKNAIAVAISDRPIGIDVQAISKVKESVASRILTEEEKEIYIKSDNKQEYLAGIWVKKESIFKCQNNGYFIPKEINTLDYQINNKIINLDDEEYYLAVYSKDNTEIIWEVCSKNDLINF